MKFPAAMPVLVLAAAAAGCAFPPRGGSEPAAPVAARPSPAEGAAVAPAKADLDSPLHDARDLGAARMVEAMAAAIDEYAPGTRATVRVEAWRLRNFSHAAPREFAAMRRRLCDMLSACGARTTPKIEFVDAQESPVDFELHGTAYMLTADGFDQWELFLSVRPARVRWTVWEADRPLRLLRNPRPLFGIAP